MANPTLPAAHKRLNLDNMHLEVEGIIVNKKPVIVSQQAYVADAADTNLGLAITFSASTPALGTGTQTIAVGTAVTDVEVGVFIANVEQELALIKTDIANKTTKINAILDILESHGLMAAS